jgi:hypothetical protein
MKRASIDADTDAGAARVTKYAHMSCQNGSSIRQNYTAPRTTNMLTLLDETSVLQVLLRTCNEDHNALWKTCRSFRKIIDSELFRQERAQQEWAQVKAKVWTADDHIKDASAASSVGDPFYSEHVRLARDRRYCALGCILDESLGGAIKNNFSIIVDGKIAGTGSYTLMERTRHVNFHEECDELSGELGATACLFFDSRGRPRLPTLKKAMAASSTRGHYRNEHLQNNYFLYLNTFTISNPEYRRNATWIGANAMRSLLLDSPLKEKWEVVIYVADPRSHFTEQDKDHETIRRKRSHGREPEESQQVVREDNEWKDCLMCLAKDDLRQFLRCGFKQATDSVLKSSGLYVFAVPDFLDRPMLSRQQAMTMNIVDKKQLSPDTTMSDEESKLLHFMVTACIKRRYIWERIVQNQANPLATLLSTAHADLDTTLKSKQKSVVWLGQASMVHLLLSRIPIRFMHVHHR